jgi:hypothetical protein
MAASNDPGVPVKPDQDVSRPTTSSDPHKSSVEPDPNKRKGT